MFQNLKVRNLLLNHFVLLKIYTCYKSGVLLTLSLFCVIQKFKIFYIRLIFRIIVSYEVIKKICLIEINKNV